MRKIVIASNNKHKIKEISALLPKDIQLISLEEIGCFEEIPEEAETLEGNAFLKANYIFEKYNTACFADDTGLEVEALQGRPGVYSARFSEDTEPNIPKEKRAEANIRKLLHLMKNAENRKAAFRTIICFINEKKEAYTFEGKIEGRIIEHQKGTEGFGYDPIFIPEGYNQTFAEMPLELKNKISHRAIATVKFLSFLE